VIEAIGAACGSPVVSHHRVAGGDINDALRAELADGRTVFVKHGPGAFALEAAGLRWLAAGPLGVPEVVAVDDAFLVLEWIEQAPRAGDFDARLGRGLAQLHALGADRFGAERTVIGSVEVPEPACDDWPSYYAQARLEPLLRMADLDDPAPVERVIARIDELCGPPEPPARLHGDLWSGNVMSGPDGSPWLVDPAAYGGHREIDLAMLSLFGSPGAEFLDAYEEVVPLADGHRDRVPLYQLLPLLVHSVLFGGHYGAAAERAARKYA
jgi:fructosamine-3-kinase